MPPQPSGELRVATPGGVFQVRWDENASASALGQLAFFGEFLEVPQLFQRWVESCPLEYTNPNAPEVRDVLGTWLLSILDGQRRYAHINGLRGDAVAPQILGMTRIISDESLRRALKALAPSIGKNCTQDERLKRQTQLDKSTEWMDAALRESTFDALSTDWILDCDTTVKLLFGHQDGAEIGYNPSKPGRPSHNIHTYWVANLRLVLDAEVKGGKTHPAKYSLPGLMRLLKALPPEKRPQLVRGDSAFGNDPVLTELESIGQMYLTKLRQTAGVKRLIERNWSRQDWQDVGQGSEAVEAQLKLSGSSARPWPPTCRGCCRSTACRWRPPCCLPGWSALRKSPGGCWSTDCCVTSTRWSRRESRAACTRWAPWCSCFLACRRARYSPCCTVPATAC